MKAVYGVNGHQPTPPATDGCRMCGPWWPAVACGLCLHCLEAAFDRFARLLGLVDADRTQLATPAAVEAWVTRMQTHADDAACYIDPKDGAA